MYCLSNVERCGATRTGYHSPKVFVSVGGVHRAHGRAVDAYRVSDLVINENTSGTPNTASFVARGWEPTKGMEVIITLGSKNTLRRLFAGSVLSVTLSNDGTPDARVWTVQAVDWSWALNRTKVIGHYTGTADAIALALMSAYAPSGFTTNQVETGLDTIDGGITFTNVDLSVALAQLAKRARKNGGTTAAKSYITYNKDLYFRVTDAADITNPTTLTVGLSTLKEFQITRDLSQVFTRVSMEGGGANAATEVSVGETILPLTDAPDTWYGDVGGVVISGPQKITYTARVEGGGGTLVGLGASPSSALTLALAAGSGVDTGDHSYAATFVTASGETLPSQISTISVGSVSAPSTAPTAGAPTAGSGVDTGAHYYAVTFVTAAGETTSSPISGTVTTGPVTTGEIAAPASAPTASTNNTVGNHLITVRYAVTFTNANGETTAGPQGVRDSIFGIADTNANGSIVHVVDGLPAGSSYEWFMTAFNSEGEETTYASGVVGGSSGAFDFEYSFTSPSTAGVAGYKFYRRDNGSSELPKYLGQTTSTSQTKYVDSNPDNSAGANAPTTNLTYGSVSLTNIPIGGSGTTGRKVYATEPGATQLKLLATISNNTAATLTDTNPGNVSRLGANVPSSNTTAATTNYNVVPLTNIPVGGALVTSRKIYRTAAGGSQLKLLTTITNNTATSYTDSTADASLGANIPTSNTAAANQVAVSAIPTGPSGTTSRRVYRTAVGSSQLKLLTTIADNVTTAYTDSTADASLGANVPVADTSGLAQSSGQVVAGATTCPVAYWSASLPTSGWAVIGNGTQVIRYTGVSSNTSLTGIPASGPGSITSSVPYNTSITAAPQLTGIPASGTGSILYTIPKGQAVNLFVTVNDALAQATLAALDGSTGIKETVLQDRRLSREEAEARAQAYLDLRAYAGESVQYRTKDMNSSAGRQVTANLAAPTSVSDTFAIQSVTITNFTTNLPPDYEVQASDELILAEDVLNREPE